ncbi:uncharacterized protein DC041_0006488 [Schistosoma bovis]|uniref:Protein AAR2 homolog n=1 Tax=Schistosoma bovis TaxID=6184 RepID=A0A430QMU0_SCHBO|nr:uncharacterized protein DC041_0006488 [Schistosoma bovis]
MKDCQLILHDVPENTELGIDLKFWRVGKHFKGIKDIPLGVHFVYYRFRLVIGSKISSSKTSDI